MSEQLTAADLPREDPVVDDLRVADPLAALSDDDVQAVIEQLEVALPGSAELPDDLRPELAALIDLIPAGPRAVFVAAAARIDRTLCPTPEELADGLAPVLWFLGHCGSDGLPLATGGGLDPVEIAALVAHLPVLWNSADEDLQLRVRQFREVLRDLGLIRRHRDRLVLTTAGATAAAGPEQLRTAVLTADPAGLGGRAVADASLLHLLLVAGGHGPDPTALAAGLAALEWAQPVGAAPAPDTVRSLVRNVDGLFAIIAPGRRRSVPFDPRSALVRSLATDLVLGRV
ncbi:hypothetical protein GIS00_25460 [Nakamurella sp. YIM 132087]|uniref:Uncharacterized protein n=1 Tax=Nakamurella alba TaxID=2665158 RepID=A0A7K1FWT5_9ACTN|nr:hypothetical protein [Nakamurella alba]MTD17284.1 hypothetical protein [Nakamurella alba]